MITETDLLHGETFLRCVQPSVRSKSVTSWQKETRLRLVSCCVYRVCQTVILSFIWSNVSGISVLDVTWYILLIIVTPGYESSVLLNNFKYKIICARSDKEEKQV
jgi:hypothetical protein